MTTATLLLTDRDRHQLQRLIDVSRPYAYGNLSDIEALQQELRQAEIVANGTLPEDVVAMNSEVRLHDLESGDEETVQLVFPALADAGHGRLSVLTAAGAAVLGGRVGDVVTWPDASGIRRLRIEEVLSPAARRLHTV
ncbi:MAG: GreA/GreB family elongation factor [Planctomycetaceae bacterium]